MNFEEVKRQEQENLMPTYGRFPVALVYGKGAVAVDTEGKEYICLLYTSDAADEL